MNFSLNQTAVFWSRQSPDGYGGYDFDDPVEIDCRWENKAELFVDPSGKEVRSRAKVVVDRDMRVGDFLYQGSLDDLTSSSTPYNAGTAYEVRGFDSIPDVSGTEFLRRAWL